MIFSQPFKCPVSNDMIRAAFDSADQQLIFVALDENFEEKPVEHDTQIWMDKYQSHVGSLDDACEYMEFALSIPISRAWL